jgi:hypothetical protein
VRPLDETPDHLCLRREIGLSLAEIRELSLELCRNPHVEDAVLRHSVWIAHRRTVVNTSNLCDLVLLVLTITIDKRKLPS